MHTDPNLALIDAALRAFALATGLRAGFTPPEPDADGTAFDGHIELREGTRTYDLLAEVKPRIDRAAMLDIVRETALAHAGDRGLLITEYLTPHLARYCRETANLLFIDTAGNAFIRLPGLHVVVQGQPRPDLQRDFTRPRAVATGTAQRIVFALLCQPELLNAPYRAIARAAGVALGAVGRVLDDLEDQRFIVGGTQHWKLLEPERLFDQWVTYYPAQLRPKLRPRRFTAERKDWWQHAEIDRRTARWGGEIAADRLTQMLQPALATLYVRKDAANAFIAEMAPRYRWRADPRGEIEVLETFWNFDDATADPLAIVPTPLVYADLIATMDPRNREIAAMIRKQALANVMRGG